MVSDRAGDLPGGVAYIFQRLSHGVQDAAWTGIHDRHVPLLKTSSVRIFSHNLRWHQRGHRFVDIPSLIHGLDDFPIITGEHGRAGLSAVPWR